MADAPPRQLVCSRYLSSVVGSDDDLELFQLLYNGRFIEKRLLGTLRAPAPRPPPSN